MYISLSSSWPIFHPPHFRNRLRTSLDSTITTQTTTLKPRRIKRRNRPRKGSPDKLNKLTPKWPLYGLCNVKPLPCRRFYGPSMNTLRNMYILFMTVYVIHDTCHQISVWNLYDLLSDSYIIPLLPRVTPIRPRVTLIWSPLYQEIVQLT